MTELRGIILIALAACLAAISACNREEPPPPPSDAAPPAVRAEDWITESYVLAKTIDPQVTGLKGIALDAQDNLYAAGAGGVKAWSPDGKLLLELSTSGPATCVALDDEGHIYVGQEKRIEVFGRDAKPLRAWGKEGRGPGELSHVTAIAVFKTNVLVADAGNRCIHRFDLTGDYVGDIGRKDAGTGEAGLICPSPYLDVTASQDGVILVTNPGMSRVERYDLDGRLLGHWGRRGTGSDEFFGCCNPTNLARMPDGRVVTAEKLAVRVKVHDESGTPLALMDHPYFTKDAAGLDLAVDSAGRILAMDPGDGRIRVFERKK